MQLAKKTKDVLHERDAMLRRNKAYAEFKAGKTRKQLCKEYGYSYGYLCHFIKSLQWREERRGAK